MTDFAGGGMRLALSTVALVACTSLASAADLGGPYEYEGSIKDGPIAAAPFSWTGFYIGANAGYGWGEIADHEPDGWFGGGQIGFNYQVGSMVLGLEADIQGADMNDS